MLGGGFNTYANFAFFLGNPEKGALPKGIVGHAGIR